jgi:F0F1-type ATP synthase assembly protein I
LPIHRLKDTLEPLGLIMRLGAIVVTAVFLTLALGLWLDNRLGTSPFGLLSCMIIGVVMAMIGVYRTVQQVYDRYSPPKEGK